MFIRQMIIDVTNIKKGTYPQQVKVLLGSKNKKNSTFSSFPSVIHRFTAHGPSIFIDRSYTTTLIAVPFPSLPDPPLAMVMKMMR